jgi:hypothetical protein
MPTRWSSSASLGIADPLAGDSIRKERATVCEAPCDCTRPATRRRWRSSAGSGLGRSDRHSGDSWQGTRHRGDRQPTQDPTRTVSARLSGGGGCVCRRQGLYDSVELRGGRAKPTPTAATGDNLIKRVPTGESRVHSNGCGTRACRPRLIGQQEINEPLSGSRMMGGSRLLGLPSAARDLWHSRPAGHRRRGYRNTPTSNGDRRKM